MKIRSLLDGQELTVRLTADHAASSYGQVVLVSTQGIALGTFDCACCELVEGTIEERKALVAAGYGVLVRGRP